MAYAYLINKVNVNVVYNGNATTSGAGSVSTTGLDITPLEGGLLVTVDARTGGTGATTVSVEHSDTSASGYTAVPAAALVNFDTGEADTFDNISTVAYEQTLGLRRDLLKKFVRVTFAGTDIDHNIAVVVTGQQKYTAP